MRSLALAFFPHSLLQTKMASALQRKTLLSLRGQRSGPVPPTAPPHAVLRRHLRGRQTRDLYGRRPRRPRIQRGLHLQVALFLLRSLRGVHPSD
jgi:hypothetical protein